MDDKGWYAYVAFPPDCECIAAVHVDEPDHRKDVARFTSKRVREGFIIQRVRGDAFRKMPMRCPLHPEGRWNKTPSTQHRDHLRK